MEAKQIIMQIYLWEVRNTKKNSDAKTIPAHQKAVQTKIFKFQKISRRFLSFSSKTIFHDLSFHGRVFFFFFWGHISYKNTLLKYTTYFSRNSCKKNNSDPSSTNVLDLHKILYRRLCPMGDCVGACVGGRAAGKEEGVGSPLLFYYFSPNSMDFFLLFYFTTPIKQNIFFFLSIWSAQTFLRKFPGGSAEGE